MKRRIKTNCDYLFQSGNVFQLDTFTGDKLKGSSKLNLFCEQIIDIQINEFFDLIEEFKGGVRFNLEEKNNVFFWSVYAEYSRLKDLQVKIKNSCFDYLLWPEESFSPPRLMLFDMDSTFIEIEVIDELAARHQVGEMVSAITESAMRGELDFAQSLITRVECLKGLNESSINEIANDLPLSSGVIELVNAAKNNSCDTAIVSGGFTPFVELLKRKYSLLQVRANRLEILSGKLTGRLLGEIVDAKAKAIFLQELCDELKILPSEAIAIGDGANDLLMMQAAGFNLAYHAKPKVQEQANGQMNHSPLNRLVDLFGW